MVTKGQDKGLTRDFRLQVFFMNQFAPGPWVCKVYPNVVVLFQICSDLGNFMSITGVNVTGDKLLRLSLIPGVVLLPLLTTPAMKQLKKNHYTAA
jgi:hypothetical protein